MNISLSVYQNVNETLTIWLLKCQRTSHYQTIKLSTDISLSAYQNADEHITIRIQTVNEHHTKQLQNVNEQPTIRSTKCSRTSHYTLIKMKYPLEKKHEKNEAIIFTLAVRIQLSGDKQPAVIEYS